MLKDKKSNLTKLDISKTISTKIGISKKYADFLLNDIFIVLKRAIKNDNINIKNFGTFRILNKTERMGRNPKNKILYKISARKSLVFNASKNLVAKINNGWMIKLLNISELSKLLNLINLKTKKPSNHILRYWEKEFKQIRPIIIRNRRYYAEQQIEIIKLIKFLLKDKGLTIRGVKNILKSNINTLDAYDSISLQADYHKKNIITKSKTILEKLKSIKKNGKKNTY